MISLKTKAMKTKTTDDKLDKKRNGTPYSNSKSMRCDKKNKRKSRRRAEICSFGCFYFDD